MNLEKTKIKGVKFEEKVGEINVIIDTELYKRQRLKCPYCGKKCWKNRAMPVRKR
jgi:hypothetical protein